MMAARRIHQRVAQNLPGERGAEKRLSIAETGADIFEGALTESLVADEFSIAHAFRMEFTEKCLTEPL